MSFSRPDLLILAVILPLIAAVGLWGWVRRRRAVAAALADTELLDRLGAKKAITSEEFSAIWKTVDLSRDRRLDLQPGDCELMAGLRDEVLPKLSIKVVSDQVRCTPKQLDIRTPELKVSALVPLPSADAPDGAA